MSPVLTGVQQQNPGLTMPLASYKLMLADPWTLDDYTDISPFVKQWSGTVMGRQHELQLFEAGQAAITLEGNLSGGRFNPWNTSSPYYNMLTPGDASWETADGTFRTVPVVSNWNTGTTTACSVFQSIPPVIIDGPVAGTISGGENQSTTVSVGSNGQQVGALTSGKLLVASTAGFAASGQISVEVNINGGGSIGVDILAYTSVTGGGTPSFNGVTFVAGISGSSGTDTVTTGYPVYQNTGSCYLQMSSNSYYPVVAGQQYLIMGSFLADSLPLGSYNSQPRLCNVTALWYKADGTTQISGISTPNITDNQTTWTKTSNVVTAPALAAYVSLEIVIGTNVGLDETHYFSRVGLFNATANVPNTAWAPGQRGLVPARPIKCTALWGGVTYPIFSMYVNNWTPKYGQVKSEMVINASDGMALLALDPINSSAYANQVLTDGALNFWRLGDALTSLVAADSGPYNQSLYASSVQFGQATPLLTDDTTTALMYSTNTGQGVVYANGTSVPTGTQSLELLFMLPTQTTENVLFSGGPESYIVFNPTNNQLIVSGGPPGTGTPASVTANVPTFDNGTWHHLVITCSSGTNGSIIVYLDGVNLNSAAGSTVVTASGGGGSCMFNGTANFWFGGGAFVLGYFPFQGSMANIAVYNTVLSASQVSNHYALFSAGWAVQYSGQRISEILTVIGWPTTLQNIATGIQQVQGATSSLTSSAALSYLQTITSTEQGALFVNQSGVVTFLDRHYIITAPAATVSNCTLSNRGSDVNSLRYLTSLTPAMDDIDLWNDVPAQRTGGVLQRASSTLSIKQYTKRSLTGYTGQLQTNDNDVLAEAQWLLAHYSIPYTRCRSITLSSIADHGKNLQHMLGRGPLDLITLVWNPIDNSTVYFNQSSLIESIQHTVTMAEWQTTWGLSPADTQPYMILNDPVKGQLSTVNQLAY